MTRVRCNRLDATQRDGSQPHHEPRLPDRTGKNGLPRCPRDLLLLYAIYWGNLVLVEKFDRSIPSGVAIFAALYLAYLIAKLLIGKELSQMKADRDRRKASK